MKTTAAKYQGVKHFMTCIAALGALVLVSVIFCIFYKQLDE
jgi:hypothetical protein